MSSPPSPSLYGWTEERFRAGGSGWHRGRDATPPSAWQARQAEKHQRTPLVRFLAAQACCSLASFGALGKTVRCGTAQKHTKNFTTSYFSMWLRWLTWFPSYLSSARLLIHPFRLMSYTTKKIDALGYYGPCKRGKIPALWQVAIKS